MVSPDLRNELVTPMYTVQQVAIAYISKREEQFRGNALEFAYIHMYTSREVSLPSLNHVYITIILVGYVHGMKQ